MGLSVISKGGVCALVWRNICFPRARGGQAWSRSSRTWLRLLSLLQQQLKPTVGRGQMEASLLPVNLHHFPETADSSGTPISPHLYISLFIYPPGLF